jgi:hypothetical protein
MRSRLKERLRKLEKALAMNPAAESCPSPAAKIAARIAAWGFVPGPCESLAETLARALGISCQIGYLRRLPVPSVQPNSCL